MASFKFDNQPDRSRIASMLGCDQYSFSVSQNPDGTWSVTIPDGALPDGVLPSEVDQMAKDSAGDVDVLAG